MVTINLTTLSGWDSLSNGPHSITVAAKAQGYPRIKQSSAVEVIKGEVIEDFYEFTFTSGHSNVKVKFNINKTDTIPTEIYLGDTLYTTISTTGSRTETINVSSNITLVKITGNCKVGITVSGTATSPDRTYIQKIKIPDSYVGILGSFSALTDLAEVVIGTGITEIPASGFNQCTSLNNVVIPANVKKIGNKAFAYNNGTTALKNITFMHTAEDSLTMPTAGSSTGAFYTKSAKQMTINHYGNPVVTGYDYASDSITPIFNPLN